MRKTSTILSGFLLATLISMLTISTAQAHIEEFVWQPPYIYRGNEYLFYDGERIVGYEHGSRAILTIPVENDRYSPYMNVTAVSLVFDTGLNITLNYTANPVKIDFRETHFFDVSFTANVTETSNLWAHTYIIYVEYNYPIVDTWTASWDDWRPSYKFVVYSGDQVEVMELAIEYDATSAPWYDFQSAEAQSLAHQAEIEGALGGTYLSRWDFANAKTHLMNAVNLYDQAFAAEKDWLSTYQETQLDILQTQAEAAMTEANATMVQANAAMKEADATIVQANAAVNQSYAWILFGLGFLIFSIAGLVYAIKKPKKA